LNTLLLIDIAGWEGDDIEKLIGAFENFSSEYFSGNLLAQSSNPIMIIALTCELLGKIA
jgi:hypothetical protein